MSNRSTDTRTLQKRAAVISPGNVAAVLFLWKIKLKKKLERVSGLKENTELNHQTTSEETKNINNLQRSKRH